MTSKYLDYQGLTYFTNKIADTYVAKEELDKLIQVKSFSEWLLLNDTVPAAGAILVYKDRTYVDNVPIPDLKLADGVTTIEELPFFSDKTVEDIVAAYVKIIDDNTSELNILGAESESQTVKRNSLVKVKGDTITATNFNGTASKVSHSLTIGDKVFDGSSTITIPIYEGE